MFSNGEFNRSKLMPYTFSLNFYCTCFFEEKLLNELPLHNCCQLQQPLCPCSVMGVTGMAGFDRSSSSQLIDCNTACVVLYTFQRAVQ